MEIKELVSQLTYDRLSRGLLIVGTAAFLYLFYELCLTNMSENEVAVTKTPTDTDYTAYFKGTGGP